MNGLPAGTKMLKASIKNIWLMSWMYHKFMVMALPNKQLTGLSEQ